MRPACLLSDQTSHTETALTVTDLLLSAAPIESHVGAVVVSDALKGYVGRV